MGEVLALDRDASVRSIDADGHLRVAVATLSRAVVSEYRGSEIPGFDKLGLRPDKIYAVLRDPKALAEGAAGFCGKPVLSQHIPLTAADHPSSAVVGAIGNDVVFDGENLRGSLTVWEQDAIDDIASGAARDLSAAYRYVAVPETGVFQGVPYTLKMTCIQANHIAIVANGRTAGAMVGDAALPEQPKGKVMSETVDPDADANTDPGATGIPGKVMHFLAGKLSADDMAQVKKLLTPDEAEGDMPEAKPGGATAKEKPAMDSGQLLNRWNAVRRAEIEVRPFIGTLEVAMDSASDVYAMALRAHDVDLQDIPPIAYRGMLRMLPAALAAQRSGGRQVARSAAETKSFNERFPNAGRLGR